MIKYKYYKQIHLGERVKDAVAVVTHDNSVKYDDPGDMFYKGCVLFALDGVIVESPEEQFIQLCENKGNFYHLPDVVAAFGKARQRRSTPQEATTIRDDAAFYLNVLQQLGTDESTAHEVAEYLRRESGQIAALYADVVETVRYFKENGFRTGLISSRHPSQLREIVAAHHLSALFDFVFTLDPSAEKSALREALTAAGVRRDDIIHIGADSQAAYPDPYGSDLDSILLDRHLAHMLDGDMLKIRSLQELPYLIKLREPGRSSHPEK